MSTVIRRGETATDTPWPVEHAIVRLTLEATEQATPAQAAALLRIARARDVRVGVGGLGLPDGYLGFWSPDGYTGGIAPDGAVST